MKEYGPEVMVVEPKTGHTFLTEPADAEDLMLVSRSTGKQP